jgi:hypothetical protein
MLTHLTEGFPGKGQPCISSFEDSKSQLQTR